MDLNIAGYLHWPRLFLFPFLSLPLVPHAAGRLMTLTCRRRHRHTSPPLFHSPLTPNRTETLKGEKEEEQHDVASSTRVTAYFRARAWRSGKPPSSSPPSSPAGLGRCKMVVFLEMTRLCSVVQHRTTTLSSTF
ncbi:hypothetical protein E2C01_053711 [Portunus trituberculatus]|uniref:Secreted protein n=1 Tax=Portunus trituberculatus TaxID=210409 RepID=A0A5B7GQU4_PORTR|nr:hypothetical protein [Portunus trituberculatus]